MTYPIRPTIRIIVDVDSHQRHFLDVKLPDAVLLKRHQAELDAIKKSWVGQPYYGERTNRVVFAQVERWVHGLIAKRELSYMSMENRWTPPYFLNGGAPHCDRRVLHAPGNCAFCDEYAEFAQMERIREGVNFTGEQKPGLYPCPADLERGFGQAERWPGNAAEKTL